MNELLIEIAEAVIELRARQKTYFRERRMSDLQLARESERTVDGLLTKYLAAKKGGAPVPGQLDMFGFAAWPGGRAQGSGGAEGQG